MSNADFEKLIEEYNLDYCYYLEAVYGEGMLSEGGSIAIKSLFEDIDLYHKTALDVGSGLGGVDLYLAENFSMAVTGIDINPAMVAEANQRVPAHLKKQLSFQIYDDLSALPFSNQHFDLVFSKGVLTHVNNKAPLFKEICRILKKEGHFIINDWLSPIDHKWGKRLLKMCEMENLTLYACSEKAYQKIIENAGFKVLDIKDETESYAKYNQQISDSLKEDIHAKNFIEKFSLKAWEEAYVAYELIADSMRDKELLVKNFICTL